MNDPMLQKILDRMTDEQHAQIDRHEAELEAKREKMRAARVVAQAGKSYTFRRSPFGPHDAYVIVGKPGNAAPTIHPLSDWQYDRFATIANSGKHQIEIMDSDYGIAWTLRRRPVEIEPDDEAIAEAYTDYADPFN